MLPEGDTVTQEIETEHLGEGHIDTITQTTTTVEHKTTGDILHADTGIVGNTKHGDMDYDWGGLGPASMPNCEAYFGSGSGKCGKGTSNSLTTFDQYVDISDFHISEGGALEWELQMYHSQNNTTGYFQTKGYKDNILQWDTGQINLENTGSPETFSGSHDFAGSLDKVFVRIGGKKNYYFDNVAYTINYNSITTTVDTWIEIVQPMQLEETITLDLVEIYDSATIEDQMEMDTMMEEMDMVINFDLEPVAIDDISTEGVPEIVDMGAMEGMFQEMDIGEISMEEVMVEIETMVQDMGMEVESVEVDMPDPQNIEVAVENTAQDNVEETVEVAENKMETTPAIKNEVKNEAESQEETTTSGTMEVKEVTEEPQEKEVVQEEVQEEKSVAKEEVKEEKQVVEEEAKEEKQVVEEEAKEESKKVVENKPTKEQERKQEKAKQIIAGLPNSYDPVSQVTTLALVNALGPNITTYQTQVVQVQPTWYVPEDIYTEAILPDPLGNYISVRSNLQMEEMIGQQYE